MTNLNITPWSEALIQQTRDAIDELPVTPDGRIHIKHPTRLILHAQTSSEEYCFAAVETLLQAGWAID